MEGRTVINISTSLKLKLTWKKTKTKLFCPERQRKRVRSFKEYIGKVKKQYI